MSVDLRAAHGFMAAVGGIPWPPLERHPRACSLAISKGLLGVDRANLGDHHGRILAVAAIMCGGRYLRSIGCAGAGQLRRSQAGRARRLRKVDMDTPQASRPYMPGYGILGPTQGSGLLPCSWAQQRLTASRDYWVATSWPDGRPHVMPVWGVWDDGAFWFSSSRRSRKTRSLAADPRCVVTTENAVEPVVEGAAEVITDPQALTRMLALENAKYQTDYSIELLDPAVNATIRVRPRWGSG